RLPMSSTRGRRHPSAAPRSHAATRPIPERWWGSRPAGRSLPPACSCSRSGSPSARALPRPRPWRSTRRSARAAGVSVWRGASRRDGIMSVSRMTSLLTVALAACLFDGEGTKGLPCNVDADCGAQRCVEGTCGGADAATTGTGEESGEESTGEPVDEQQLPEPCEDGHMACLGSNAMEICEDGKLHQFQCEWW